MMSARAKMERCDKPEYVVPEGMMGAVTTAVVDRTHYQIPPGIQEIALEAALEWLAKYPIVPTPEQAQDIFLKDYSSGSCVREIYSAREEGALDVDLTTAIKINMAVEWQRRMFLKPPKPPVHPECQRWIDEAREQGWDAAKLTNLVRIFERAYKLGREDGEKNGRS